jgi:hypothetical protein
MGQLGLLIIAAALFFGGLWPLLGLEKAKKKTHPGVAITMIVLSVGLVVVAFVVIPRM